MPIVIQPYREEHQSAVQAFNHRLRAPISDVNFVWPENCTPVWLPKIAGSPLHNQYFLALEDGAVRGAYALKYERFFSSVHGEYTVACYHHPLSEGIVNRSYAAVGSLLLRDAVWREPVLYALGMGGMDRPLAKMLKVMGWNLQLVPFYLRVVRPYRFLRQMNALRDSAWRRWLMELGAISGAGWAAISTVQRTKQILGSVGSFEAEEIDDFPAWSESLWLDAKDTYRVTSVRDQETISRIYPPTEKQLTKLSISQQGRVIGWAIIGERRKDNKYGSLRVGSIVDCWAHPENAAPVMLAASRALERQGMDLILSNQSHQDWGRALRRCGFFQAQSNFVFATSKQHTALTQGNFSQFHLTRANGDGLPRNF